MLVNGKRESSYHIESAGTAGLYTGNGLATTVTMANFEYVKSQVRDKNKSYITIINDGGKAGTAAYGYAAISCGYICYAPEGITGDIRKVEELLKDLGQSRSKIDMTIETFVYEDTHNCEKESEKTDE